MSNFSQQEIVVVATKPELSPVGDEKNQEQWIGDNISKTFLLAGFLWFSITALSETCSPVAAVLNRKIGDLSVGVCFYY